MPSTIDGLLVQWGDRLFYPSNRSKASRTPALTGLAVQQRAQALRQRIRATVVRRAPQVMVKVTGGGRGMGAIAAHLRYISKGGRLPIEDDRGAVREGKETLRAIADQWRLGGTRIPEVSERREAFNIMLSMPTGTDARVMQQAAREFAKAELANHRYVMVLHTHQAKSACAHQRARGGTRRQAPEPAQGRPASLARDLCRAAAWLGHRGRGVVAGYAGHTASQRTGVGTQDHAPWRTA
jgi:hypothetical protein